MPTLDLAFALVGTLPIPVDHGYLLYGALSHALPALHQQNGVAVHPIRGRQIGNRQLELCDWSALTIRTADDRISEWIQLAGKSLRIGGSSVRVGVPSVLALVPATALRSRLVTTKNGNDTDRFVEELRRQLTALSVSADAIATVVKRRTLRIKDKEVVGHEVLLEGLTAEESLAVQEHGLGGRRHMGCGVFTPLN